MYPTSQVSLAETAPRLSFEALVPWISKVSTTVLRCLSLTVSLANLLLPIQEVSTHFLLLTLPTSSRSRFWRMPLPHHSMALVQVMASSLSLPRKVRVVRLNLAPTYPSLSLGSLPPQPSCVVMVSAWWTLSWRRTNVSANMTGRPIRLSSRIVTRTHGDGIQTVMVHTTTFGIKVTSPQTIPTRFLR